MLNKLAMLFSILLPWPWRRRFLEWRFGYRIHPTCAIGLAWICPRQLIMEEHARIGHLTVAKGLELLHLGPHAIIGQLNWITGFPIGVSRHFAQQTERRPEFILEKHAGVSSRHFIDCTARIRIGAFSTLAGFRSQLISHSIDLETNRQACAPIEIGEYCFVGTEAVVLGGASLPHHSVLGAKSLLNKKWSEPYHLYGGVPARPLKKLSEEMGYFQRTEGFVW